MELKMTNRFALLFGLAALTYAVFPQTSRIVSGRVVTNRFESVTGANVEIGWKGGTVNAVTDDQGRFTATLPGEATAILVTGRNLVDARLTLGAGEAAADVVIKVSYVVPPISETVTIQDDALTPNVEFRNGAVYANSLFARDDQLIQTLNAGVSAGQHEGGGKSLEIRRYGYNLDHGGVNGGLKILVDNIQQNQGTQGHGQGYLGSLKSLSPELVESVSIINGPFSAAYGDFSGLGVVQIRQREELPEVFTARLQGGSFNTARGFFAYSPGWRKISSFIAYEPSYTDGPFDSPLRYTRHNLSGNVTFKQNEMRSFGVKFNAGTNSFFSSGQIPLDRVAAGEVGRFGFIDPDNGGRNRSASIAGYFRQEFGSGAVIRADAFVARSLFDLFSNFTFFLADPIYEDEIQQHDSRLQEGGNLQFLQPYKVFSMPSVLTVGLNLHANQINVGLYPSVARAPNRKFLPGNDGNPDVLLTTARARVNNYAGYVQNETNLFDGHLRIEAGLRFDYFGFKVDGSELREVQKNIFADEGETILQPKLAVAWSPFERLPVSFYGNYGRGIVSQDARGIARSSQGPKVATTDFYQAGASYNSTRISAVFSSFLIDRSNEQVYIPDDGSIEFAGPSRSYGIEGRATLKITRYLSFNWGMTKVIQAIYPGEFTAEGRRAIVDGAPHLVANGGLVLSDLCGFTGSLTWRHASSYRLDGDDPSIKASGSDVVDLAVSKQLNRRVRLNLAIDNLLNKKYFETQNYFESRTCPTCEVASRIHATPGYPFTFSAGVTFSIGQKN